MKQQDSMRGLFASELYTQMKKDKDIWLITADLGYGMWDRIRDDFPNRFLNTGAAEQAAMDIAIGLALEGKIPFVYSITPFLLYRPFESIRTYINHESIPVKMVASGRYDDYKHDGFSHFAGDDKDFLQHFENIDTWWPTTDDAIPELVQRVVDNCLPTYINLRR